MAPQQQSFQTIAKGLAIILVVFGHSWRSMNSKLNLLDAPFWHWLDFTIYTTHMPLFFVLAGYNAWGSLQRHSISTNFKHKIKRIALPYLFWSTLFVASQMLLAPPPAPVWVAYLSILYSPVGIYWFLFALFLMHLSLFAAPGQARPLFALSILCAALSTFHPHPWAGLFLHAPFFYLGFALANANININLPQLKQPLFAIASLLFLVMATLWLYQAPWPAVSLITLPCTMAGLIFLLAVSQLRLAGWQTDLLTLFGKNSFPIYLMHIFVTTGVVSLAAKLHITNSPAILIASLAIGLVAPILIATLYQKAGSTNSSVS